MFHRGQFVVGAIQRWGKQAIQFIRTLNHAFKDARKEFKLAARESGILGQLLGNACGIRQAACAAHDQPLVDALQCVFPSASTGR